MKQVIIVGAGLPESDIYKLTEAMKDNPDIVLVYPNCKVDTERGIVTITEEMVREAEGKLIQINYPYAPPPLYKPKRSAPWGKRNRFQKGRRHGTSSWGGTHTPDAYRTIPL